MENFEGNFQKSNYPPPNFSPLILKNFITLFFNNIYFACSAKLATWPAKAPKTSLDSPSTNLSDPAHS